jgi:hypothetical protein
MNELFWANKNWSNYFILQQNRESLLHRLEVSGLRVLKLFRGSETVGFVDSAGHYVYVIGV